MFQLLVLFLLATHDGILAFAPAAQNSRKLWRSSSAKRLSSDVSSRKQQIGTRMTMNRDDSSEVIEESTMHHPHHPHQLEVEEDHHENSPSAQANRRRSFLNRAAIGAVSMMGACWWYAPTEPANAVTGASKVNAKLQGYGLPTTSVPDGFIPVCDIYGKGKNRFPLLVTFSYPLTWVLTLPSNDVNGEDGTIQAGEYAKGDTATLFVYTDPGRVDSITKQSKDLYERALIKSISQKGDNMYQNFKLTKLEPAPYSFGKQDYMLADFKYQLLTGAGFEVDRKGVASITSAGDAVEVFWAASTSVRYKKTESVLRDIVSTFRCYADGINLSSDLYNPGTI